MNNTRDKGKIMKANVLHLTLGMIILSLRKYISGFRFGNEAVSCL